MNQLSTINMTRVEDKIMVSSKEVAEKFGKEHKDVLRAVRELQVTDIFNERNFTLISEDDVYGREQPVVYMTKDGFMILAFGFTGKKALDWKLGFLEAFNKMENVITDQLPSLKSEVELLRRKNHELTKQIMLLPEPKKQHGNKNTVVVPIAVSTLFGTDIEFKRVPKNLDSISDMTYKEGEIRRLSNLMTGMINKINRLGEDLSKLRRM